MTGSPGTMLAADLPPSPRAALVIATASYQDTQLSQLRAAADDARALAAVLGDPDIGGFTVTPVMDGDERQVRRSVDAFLSGRGIGDVVLVYLSCHGVLDRRNRLYFAAADTAKDQLGGTGIPAEWLMEQLEECRARQQVVILDCCFSGAFAHGSKGDGSLDLDRRMAGNARGRAVLTASRSGEYSFTGDALTGAPIAGSVFTAGLVEGLRTGAADADGDGYITVDEAYDFAYRYVLSFGPPRLRSGRCRTAKGGSCSPAARPAWRSLRPVSPTTTPPPPRQRAGLSGPPAPRSAQSGCWPALNERPGPSPSRCIRRRCCGRSPWRRRTSTPTAPNASPARSATSIHGRTRWPRSSGPGQRPTRTAPKSSPSRSAASGKGRGPCTRSRWQWRSATRTAPNASPGRSATPAGRPECCARSSGQWLRPARRGPKSSPSRSTTMGRRRER